MFRQFTTRFLTEVCFDSVSHYFNYIAQKSWNFSAHFILKWRKVNRTPKVLSPRLFHLLFRAHSTHKLFISYKTTSLTLLVSVDTTLIWNFQYDSNEIVEC